MNSLLHCSTPMHVGNRHGACSGPAQLRLQWHENGGPLVTTPGRPSYGTSVIRELVPYELGGTVEIEYKEKGVSCTIEFAIQSDGDGAAPLRSEHHAKND